MHSYDATASSLSLSHSGLCIDLFFWGEGGGVCGVLCDMAIQYVCNAGADVIHKPYLCFKFFAGSNLY